MRFYTIQKGANEWDYFASCLLNESDQCAGWSLWSDEELSFACIFNQQEVHKDKMQPLYSILLELILIWFLKDQKYNCRKLEYTGSTKKGKCAESEKWRARVVKKLQFGTQQIDFFQEG